MVPRNSGRLYRRTINRRQGGRREGVNLEYLVLDAHRCACKAEACEQNARHCPPPIDKT